VPKETIFTFGARIFCVTRFPKFRFPMQAPGPVCPQVLVIGAIARRFKSPSVVLSRYATAPFLQCIIVTFGQVPTDILAMSSLTSLDLKNNRLTQMPTLAENVRIVNLSGNAFNQWPDCLGLLSQLEKLDISQNRLALVPPNALEASAVTMRSLTLANNLLTSLPFSIGQLSLLTHFDVDENPLSLTDPDNPLRSHSGDLPGELICDSMLVLKYLGAMNSVVRGSADLDLRGIGLRTVPESIFRLQSFKRLLLDKNLFVYVPMRVGMLKVRALQSNSDLSHPFSLFVTGTARNQRLR